MAVGGLGTVDYTGRNVPELCQARGGGGGGWDTHSAVFNRFQMLSLLM